MIKFMPQQDPLEELFRRSAEGAQQRPSLKAWHRLEQRLDTPTLRRKPLRRTQGYFKAWHYAAAAVILVLVMLFGIQQQQMGLTKVTLAQLPESVEELNIDTAAPQSTQVARYISVPEGSSREFLTVRNSKLPQFMPAEAYRL